MTTRGEPFTEVGRGVSTRRGVKVRLRARLARRARRKGLALRAEVWERENTALQMVWRLRVPAADRR